MRRFIWIIVILMPLIFGNILAAQESDAESADETGSPIDGTWITQSGNLVELELDGTDVDLYFPEYARTKSATFNGSVLVYVTHYNDPDVEECYVNVPESERRVCERFIHRGDPRHRFTLTLSEDGMVLAGIKEINVLQCEWETNENGNFYNHKSIGYRWEYHSDYQWRRSDCSFSDLPPLDGNALDRYNLVTQILDRYELTDEFSLGDFNIRERIRFNYIQDYLDADTGVFVPFSEAYDHQHIEPLDGRVYLDEESGKYIIELYPYSFETYVTLLSGLTMLCHQLQALESSDRELEIPTTQMEIDSVNYVWSHRQALCSIEDDNFDHHIDFISRALQYRAMSE